MRAFTRRVGWWRARRGDSKWTATWTWPAPPSSAPPSCRVLLFTALPSFCIFRFAPLFSALERFISPPLPGSDKCSVKLTRKTTALMHKRLNAGLDGWSD